MRILIFNNIDNLNDDFTSRFASFLPEWRKEQMLRYKFPKGKIQNGLAYVLLVRLLIDECGREHVLNNLPEFSYNEHGKPFLSNHPDLFFSISHCNTAVAVGLSKLPLGIDIEDVTRYKKNVAAYVSNDDELKKINGSEHPEFSFIELWTKKEAVFKYNGTGITDDIKNILYNTDCQLYTKLFDNKSVSIATKEILSSDVFNGVFVKINDLDFI